MFEDDRTRPGPGSYESPFPKHLIPNMDEIDDSDQMGIWNKIDEKPKILLMGLRRKSLQLKPSHYQIRSGSNEVENYLRSLHHLLDIFKFAFEHNMNCKFEVFIHKVDGLSDQKKIDIQREITQWITNKVENYLSGQPPNTNLTIGFHLTTIYDHSIFEAFSKVAQKLIPYLDAFEHLLNTFIHNSMIDKVFMLDVASKIYLATDSGAVDMQTYELCCDMIDLVVDIRTIYTPQVEPSDSTFTEETGTTITMNNEKVLYLRGLNDYLALACLMPEECLEKIGIIDYNFKIVREGLQRIFELGERYTRLEMNSMLGQLNDRLRGKKTDEVVENEESVELADDDNEPEDEEDDEYPYDE